jgi:hypothetical protein
MESRIGASGLSFEVRMVDIWSLDGDPLLESEILDDHMVRILARQADTRRAVRRVSEKIAVSGSERRAKALAALMLLAGLRSLAGFIKEMCRF